MRSLREFTQFVGKPNPPISLQGLSAHLFSDEATSLRTMIQQFEALPAPFDFALDVNPRSGSAPLLVNTRYANFVGIRIRGLLINTNGFRVLKDGQVIRIAKQTPRRASPTPSTTAVGMSSKDLRKVSAVKDTPGWSSQ